MPLIPCGTLQCLVEIHQDKFQVLPGYQARCLPLAGGSLTFEQASAICCWTDAARSSGSGLLKTLAVSTGKESLEDKLMARAAACMEPPPLSKKLSWPWEGRVPSSSPQACCTSSRTLRASLTSLTCCGTLSCCFAYCFVSRHRCTLAAADLGIVGTT